MIVAPRPDELPLLTWDHEKRLIRIETILEKTPPEIAAIHLETLSNRVSVLMKIAVSILIGGVGSSIGLYIIALQILGGG